MPRDHLVTVYEDAKFARYDAEPDELTCEEHGDDATFCYSCGICFGCESCDCGLDRTER